MVNDDKQQVIATALKNDRKGKKDPHWNLQLVIVISKESSTQEVIQSWPKLMHL